jgi:hypothetical protein
MPYSKRSDATLRAYGSTSFTFSEFSSAASPSRRALEQLDLLPKRDRKRLEANQWSGYLVACRELSGDCDLTLQEVGRALGAGGFIKKGPQGGQQSKKKGQI